MEQVCHRQPAHQAAVTQPTTITPEPTESPTHSPQDVDKKIAEQLQLFESQNEVRKRPELPMKPSVDIPSVDKLRLHSANAPGALWDKPHGLGIERFETVLEEVKEMEEESLESPKKLKEEKKDAEDQVTNTFKGFNNLI